MKRIFYLDHGIFKLIKKAEELIEQTIPATVRNKSATEKERIPFKFISVDGKCLPI